MNRFSHMLVFIITILVFVGRPASNVNAAPQRQDWAVNPAAEDYVRAEILADGDADLSKAFAGSKARTVGADFIVGLWQDPAFQTIPFFKLRNATILGDIRAEGISIPFNVECWKCRFLGRIEMSRAKVQAFNMYDSVVTGAVRMGRMEVTGDLALYTTVYESPVVLFDATIGGSLLAKGSQFNGVEKDRGTTAPFELWKVQVGQTAEFVDAVIKGDALLEEAEFLVDVKFSNTTFEKPANFKNVRVGNLADFQGTIFKDDVNFESGIVSRDADFTGAVFDGNAKFDYFATERFIDFDDATFNQDFSFVYTTVGWPYFEGAVFNGPVDFEGMQATHDFDLTHASYNTLDDPFTVSLAAVDGHTLLEDFVAPAGISLEHNEFGDLSLSGRDNQEFAFIKLSSTTVAGDISLTDVTTNEFIAQGLTVQDSTTFIQVDVKYTLDMSNASLGFFTMDDQLVWPKDPKSFNLRGMTYSDIGLVTYSAVSQEWEDQELDESTWRVLLRMVEESAYSPQAYRTLSQFLTEKGQPDWAAEVELTQKRRERDQVLEPRSGPWFWSWFLDIFSGYGQRPDFAFIWSALVIAVGAIVFRREEDMVILDDSEARPPYNPVLYSFALFLPYIDLDIARKWDPKPHRKFAGIYKHIHRLMGWVLMPIALLTFGGIIS
ncbi:MAG TPA: pentapeptide repeat-containing protein [Anaerolineales bacterium]|nr:pentapeptide repeat-containing protein [Anaerolineales bacterium]